MTLPARQADVAESTQQEEFDMYRDAFFLDPACVVERSNLATKDVKAFRVLFPTPQGGLLKPKGFTHVITPASTVADFTENCRRQLCNMDPYFADVVEIRLGRFGSGCIDKKADKLCISQFVVHGGYLAITHVRHAQHVELTDLSRGIDPKNVIVEVPKLERVREALSKIIRVHHQERHHRRQLQQQQQTVV